eukprot:scaffold48828_cov75-Cyclotella_meneghiniana.AAC.7
MAASIISLILLAAPLAQFSHAFKPQIRPPINYERFSSRTNNVNVEAPAEKSSMTTLNLIGEVTITSKESPSPNSNGKDLMEFFSLTGSAPLILRGSKNNRIVEIPNPDVSLLEAYHEQCQVVGAQTPKPDDKFFDVTTSGVEFPGLKVTGKDKNNSKEATTQSLNTIRTVKVEGDEIAFEANASLRIQMKFPSVLMKVIPKGKEGTEKTGGDSLRKVLEADIPVALNSFRQEYITWLTS